MSNIKVKGLVNKFHINLISKTIHDTIIYISLISEHNIMVYPTEQNIYHLPTRVIGSGHRLNTYHHNEVANEISYHIYVMDPHLHVVPS